RRPRSSCARAPSCGRLTGVRAVREPGRPWKDLAVASLSRAPILIAPAPFKGTLRAPQVAAALARGLEAGGWPVDPCPLADGGAGAVAALAEGDEIRASIVLLCDVRTSADRVAEALAGSGALERERATALGARIDALASTLPRDPRGVAHSGAGGGIAGALW